jgi:YHS domain-containing protein
MTAAEPLSSPRHHAPVPPAEVRDPVCGMPVDPAKAKHRAEHAGHSYVFCSARCREKFTAEPARYVVTSPQGRAPAADGEALWTCPMHPQIVRAAPGNLPDLRHGLGADDARGRRNRKSRIARHDAALLGRCRALAAVARHRHGRAFQRSGA